MSCLMWEVDLKKLGTWNHLSETFETFGLYKNWLEWENGCKVPSLTEIVRKFECRFNELLHGLYAQIGALCVWILPTPRPWLAKQSRRRLRGQRFRRNWLHARRLSDCRYLKISEMMQIIWGFLRHIPVRPRQPSTTRKPRGVLKLQLK